MLHCELGLDPDEAGADDRASLLPLLVAPDAKEPAQVNAARNLGRRPRHCNA